jgi:tripartite-type tricarboxylate transporter receptor subunit TctC
MRRSFLRAGCLGAVLGTLALVALPAAAQPYPAKPIRIIVPFVAGGSSDIVARSVAARMQANLGQTVVVENRPGANGAIAAESVVRAAPDGYTLMVGSIGTFAINAALHPKLSYDPLKDLEPLTLAVTNPNVLVAGANFPVSNVRELIAYARKHPGKLTYASSGTGSSDHLSAELFKLQTNTFGVHIPYRGGAAAMSDLMGGNVDVSFQNLGAAVPHIKSGRLKALGVTSEVRRPQLPDTATLIEQGVPGFVVTSWQAFMGPRGMPREVIARLHAELVAALTSAEVRTRFAQQGFDVVANKPEEFAAFQRQEIERWREVVQKKGLTPE